MSLFSIRPLALADRDWLDAFIARRWGAPIVAAHRTVYRPAELEGFAARQDDDVSGLVTFHVSGSDCEIVTLDSLREGVGVGTALIAAVADAARARGCKRLWLITTNDNLHAMRFYQKRGFALVAVHRNAVAAARRLKPQIPLTGNDGIPIRDEIELEMTLE